MGTTYLNCRFYSFFLYFCNFFFQYQYYDLIFPARCDMLVNFTVALALYEYVCANMYTMLWESFHCPRHPIRWSKKLVIQYQWTATHIYEYMRSLFLSCGTSCNNWRFVALLSKNKVVIVRTTRRLSCRRTDSCQLCRGKTKRISQRTRIDIDSATLSVYQIQNLNLRDLNISGFSWSINLKTAAVTSDAVGRFWGSKACTWNDKTVAHPKKRKKVFMKSHTVMDSNRLTMASSHRFGSN